MSEEGNTIVDRIEYAFDILKSGDDPGWLEMISRSGDSRYDDIVFNLITKVEVAGISDEDTIGRLQSIVEQRMESLRERFAGRSVGRNAPGKMEYDTTLQAWREFKERLEQR